MNPGPGLLELTRGVLEQNPNLGPAISAHKHAGAVSHQIPPNADSIADVVGLREIRAIPILNTSQLRGIASGSKSF